MRYLSVMFNPWDRKTWAYTYDGADPVEPGDRAEVETKNGLVSVTVEAVSDERPASAPAHIELKPIVRVLPRATEGGPV